MKKSKKEKAIKAGKADPALYSTGDWYIRQEGSVIRQIRPTEVYTIKELWSGSINGMNKIGRLEIPTDLKSWYADVTFEGVTFHPLAIVEWGAFLVGYLNSITKGEL